MQIEEHHDDTLLERQRFNRFSYMALELLELGTAFRGGGRLRRQTL